MKTKKLKRENDEPVAKPSAKTNRSGPQRMTHRGFRVSQTQDKAEVAVIPQFVAPDFENTVSKTIRPPTSINLINPNIG
jgi:hypothetical protein